MTFRKFDTATWNDPWFESLSDKAKLGFIYFWTNEICNQAGIYEISPKRIKFELGYHIDTIYSEINTKILWVAEKNLVWVLNFFKRQCQNAKFAIAALNSISNDRYKLHQFITYNLPLLQHWKIDLSAYHIDTISIPYLLEEEQRREETDRETEKKVGSCIQIYNYPDWLNKDLFFDFVRMRSRIKAPITTERTITGLINKLDQIIKDGHKQNEVIQSSIDNCWKSFFAPKQNSGVFR